jgi:hypothetical protein
LKLIPKAAVQIDFFAVRQSSQRHNRIHD